MIYKKLGNTKIEVSKLCFGGLTVGPLQKNLSFEEGGKVIEHAFKAGVNFIDTAQLYKTYGHIDYALKRVKREDVVIASKSYAYDIKTAKESLEEALREMGTDYIDIFMLHEQESEHTIRGHYEALEYYMKMKEKGYIRALGLSTHCVAGVKGANKYSEIEVIHPIINKAGLGIQDGSLDQMLAEVKKFSDNGGGVFSMKPIGGGHLISKIDESIDFVQNLDFVHSIAVGMQSIDEVEANVAKFTSGFFPKELSDKLGKVNRQLHVGDWCIGCKQCEIRCTHGAIKVVDGKAIVNRDKCVLCSYCSTVCPEFCIKVI